MESRVLATVVLLLLSASGSVDALAHGRAAETFSFERREWNVKGDVLVLDAGSLMALQSGQTSEPMPEWQCSNLCSHTPGANAWVYCNSEAGCGSGCAAYTADHPTLSLADSTSTSADPAWFKLTAIIAFGPFGANNKCKGDKWPQGICTLLKSPTPNAPTFWSQDPSEGWVSGTAAFPKECEGLTLRTCTRCANSKDPAKCRACANRSDLKFGLLQGLYAESPALADGCGLCVNSNQTNMCMACVAAGAPCADCALVGDVENPNFDPSACLLCTQKQGPGFVSPCLQCAHSGDIAGAVSECMSCLDTMAPLACNTTDPNQAPKLGCWDTSDPWSMGACGTCVRHPDTTHSGMCMACIHTSPYTNACQRCAVIKDECKQARCFQCVDASQHNPSSGCADCLESLWEPAKQQRCLACMSNPKLSTKAKESCYLCHERCWSPEAAASCVQCLETEQEDYNACFSSC